MQSDEKSVGTSRHLHGYHPELAQSIRHPAEGNRAAEPHRAPPARSGGGKQSTAQATGAERRGHRHPKKIRRHTFQTIEDKYKFIQSASAEVSVDQLCRLLEISRSGYYAWLHRGISPRKLQDQRLSRQLITLHQQQPASGLDTLFHLIRKKMVCSRKRIYRLMRQLHIQSARKFAYKRTTNSKHSHPVAPNLLNRNFQVSKPNTVWVGDITYIPTGQGWLYLAIIKDLCTKKVVGYAFSNRIDTALTLTALRMAVRREHPAPGLMVHSDRGVQYAAAAYREELEKLGFVQSMSRKGEPHDNAVAENFFSFLKCELVYLTSYATRRQAQNSIFRYIEGFYNPVRPHSSIGWLSPMEYARQLKRQNVA